MRSKGASRRWVTVSAVIAMLAYIGWMGGPYLRSIIVRDAAVTSWIYIANAPIDGVIDGAPLKAGQRVGADGRITMVHNERVDPTAADTAVARLTEAEARLAALLQRRTSLEALIAERDRHAAAYARIFIRDLATEIETTNVELASLDRQLALEQQLAERMAKLAKSGSASLSDADSAAVRVAEIESERAARAQALARASLRFDAAQAGIFLLQDGNDPDWGERSLERLRLELLNLEIELAAAESLVEVARAKLKGIHQHYRALSTGDVQAPPGVLIWSLAVGPGSAVVAGSPVAHWLDCGVMLVDVPASDAEISLLQVGSPAEVVLEGEDQVRAGRVLLTRGAASTLGQVDLAAVAKGRQPGVGQVLVELTPTPQDIAACPMAHAAYVDFPEVGLLDILRVRLRL